MEAAKKRGTSRAAKIILAALLVAGLIPFASASCASKAYAANTSYLDVGEKIYYAGHLTTKMWADGAPAFCANPNKNAPASGTYEKHDIQWGAQDQGGAVRYQIRAVLYHGWGGPEFDPNAWPSTWYDGTPMTDERYIVLEHVLLSDLYSYDLWSAVHGCSADFTQYIIDNVTGYNRDGTPIDNFENTTRHKITAITTPVPDTFNAFVLATGSSTQNIVSFEQGGTMRVVKTSASNELTASNSCYSLEGAVYGVYRDVACTDEVATLTTDASGTATSGLIPVGTYYVREKSAPRGYALDDKAYPVTVSSGQTAVCTLAEAPLSSTLGTAVAKADAQTGLTEPQGDGLLAFAEFTYRYYDGYFSSEAELAGHNPARTWVMRTDSCGITDLARGNETFEIDGEAHAYKASGDSFYLNDQGEVVVPLGTLVISETKAPEGYLPSSEEPAFVQFTQSEDQVIRTGSLQTVTYQPEGRDAQSIDAIVVNEKIVHGGVSVSKRDGESLLPDPLGAASLNPTSFAIVNKSAHPVVVDGTTYEPGSVVKTLVTLGGSAQIPATDLPFGTYGIQEISTGVGYNLTDRDMRTFTIRSDGQMVTFEGENAFENIVKRGDVELVKAREADQSRLAHVPFKITSLTTGESHILVTDQNGYASTAASFNAHSYMTNANDQAVLEGGVDEEALSEGAGIWFGQTSESSLTSPNDQLGALPYDTYAIEELPCSANEGLKLITLDAVTITRDSYTVDLGTLDNQSEPELATVAHDALDGDKQVFADIDSSIIDRVYYAGATVGSTYQLTAQLYDKETSQLVERDGHPLTFTATFEAKRSAGYAEMSIGPLDTLALAGHDVVVFETLADLSAGGKTVAEHRDADDSDQTVSITPPRIGTSAADAVDGDRAVTTDPASTLVDVVSYSNLVPDAAYVACATLMVGSADQNEGAQPLEVQGSAVTAEAEFSPATPSGTIEVRLEGVDTTALAEKRLVVFEKLYRIDGGGERIEVAYHEDAADAAQTLLVQSPQIATVAADGYDGDSTVVADPASTITDIVSYSGLVPHRTYNVVGHLVRKTIYLDAYEAALSTGSTEQEAQADAFNAAAVRDESGEIMASSTLLEPQESQGSTSVSFSLDTRTLAGEELVAFEGLFADDALVAAHADINDAGQTLGITASSLSTSATNSVDNGKGIDPIREVTVVDAVTYENLMAGTEYRLRGTLMDKETGKELVVNGSTIEKEITFTPEEASGTINLAFTFDASQLGGKTLVAFEELFKDDVTAAVHADLEDEAQTVFVSNPPEESGLPQTGDKPLLILTALIAAGAAAAGAVCAVAMRRSRRSRR